MPCPICKRICTLHALLYTHKCTKDAREAKLKTAEKVIEKIIEKPVPMPEPEVIEAAPIQQGKHPRQVLMDSRSREIREALMEKRLAYEARQRELHITPILNYFNRS